MPTSTADRGYGTQHQKTRAAAFAGLPEYSPCVRCGRTMWKHAVNKHGKSAIHFDHNRTRDGYIGFSHQWCNNSAGGRHNHRPTRRSWHSRRW